MSLHLLAGIDWPFLALAILGAIFALTWPAFRKLTRGCNVAFAEGDFARSLDLALRLRRSWLPMAMLQRWSHRGQMEAAIAMRYYLLGELTDALAWAEGGLRIARVPQSRATLHMVAAQVYAYRNQPHELEHHLAEYKTLWAKHRSLEVGYPGLATVCYFNAGRLDRAYQLFRSELTRSQIRVDGTLFQAGLWALVTLGRFGEVFDLTKWMLEAGESEATDSRAPSMSAVQSSLGVDRVREWVRRLRDYSAVFAAITAAEYAGQWDLHERYLRIAESAETADPQFRLPLTGHKAILAARRGDRAEVARRLAQMDQLTALRPRNRQLRNEQSEMVVRVWHHLEAHERVLAEIENASRNELSPVAQSRMAALAAQSLEALGRPDEARNRREEAKRLAPLAWWNGAMSPSESVELEAIPRVELRLPIAEAQPAASTKPVTADGPIAPVASGLACWVWILAIPALVPVVGSLVGLALITLSVLLLAHHRSLAHDRRVGLAGLVIALWSIAFGGITLGYWMTTPEPALREEEMVEVERAVATPAHEQGHVEQAGTDAGVEPGLSWPQGILLIAVLLVSIMLHEIGHAVAACWSGDPTARDAGRFSLNPIRHMDLLGSVIVPMVLMLLPGGAVIGWAKPVPFKYHRLRHARRGQLAIGLAGVSLNMLLALAAADLLALILMVLTRWYSDGVMGIALAPFAPSHLPDVPYGFIWAAAIEVCKTTILINGLLTGFNLLIIPPLDGFHVLRSIMPQPISAWLGRLSGIGVVLLLVLIAFNALAVLLLPAIYLIVLLLALAQGIAGIPV